MIDEELVLRATRGDHDALEQVCRRSWPQLYRFVYHKVQNREEAEDVTQEAYIRTLKSLKRYSAGSFLGLLRTVALNIVRDRWRKGQGHGMAVPLAEVFLPSDDPTAAVADRERLRTALHTLPEEQQQVIELRIIQGFSTAETAERMGKTEAAVRTLQYRAVQALREVMA